MLERESDTLSALQNNTPCTPSPISEKGRAIGQHISTSLCPSINHKRRAIYRGFVRIIFSAGDPGGTCNMFKAPRDNPARRKNVLWDTGGLTLSPWPSHDVSSSVIIDMSCREMYCFSSPQRS